MESNYDVSVCIPMAGDWPHLYFVVNQCASLLVASKLTHEIIVVANNTKREVITDAVKLISAPGVGFHNARLLVNDLPSNGLAANKAAEIATGRYLAFMDSHVVLSPNIFEECIKVMNCNDSVGMVHSPITWTGVPYDANFNFIPNQRCYQYRYKEGTPGGEWYLHQHFHGVYNHTMVSPRPYPIAGCGHGFYMVKRKVWEHIGGYHTGQRAYGGREAFVTFKMWLFGYRNFTVPTTNHCHYNGRRLYEWTDENGSLGNDVWLRNSMMQAYSIGGDKWLDKIYEKFKSKRGVKAPIIKKLRDEAFAASQEERKFVEHNQMYEFDELFKVWDDGKVYY